MIVSCSLVVLSGRGWHDPVLLFFGLTWTLDNEVIKRGGRRLAQDRPMTEFGCDKQPTLLPWNNLTDSNTFVKPSTNTA